MLEGNYDRALLIQDKLLPLHRATFLEPSPAPIKYALSKLGKCSNELRAPLVSINDNTKKIMDNALRHAELIN